jgi:Rha family phage regulatory protein
MHALVTLYPAGHAATTSLVVAERFGKRHDTVLRAIRNLQVPADWRLRNFAEASQEVPQPNGGVASYPIYIITRDGFSILAMGFTGKAAMEWKLKFLDAFNRLETALCDPRLRAAAARLAELHWKAMEIGSEDNQLWAAAWISQAFMMFDMGLRTAEERIAAGGGPMQFTPRRHIRRATQNTDSL